MLRRRDVLKLMGAVALGLATTGLALPKKKKRKREWSPVANHFSGAGGRPSRVPYQRIWGLGSSYLGMTAANRLSVLTAAKDMGCTWIKDSLTWAQAEGTQGTLDPLRSAQLASTIAQVHGLGMRYFLVLVVNAPSWATGGGSGTYPTNATQFAAFTTEFSNFITLFLTTHDVDAFSVGAEMSGSDYWLPDGVAANKTVAAACPRYQTFYNSARTAAKAIRPGIIVASSSGDSDKGYVNNWATTLSRLGFWPDWYCIYDYRFQGAYPYSWDVPEENTQAQTQGTVAVNLAYYQALFPGLPIVITETGYVHNATRVGRSDISRAVHASLYCRIAAMASASRPGGVFLHDAVDEPQAESGVMEADYKPRLSYTALKTLLNYMPPLDWVRQSGATWTAGAHDANAICTWNTTTDAFSFSFRGHELSI